MYLIIFSEINFRQNVCQSYVFTFMGNYVQYLSFSLRSIIISRCWNDQGYDFIR